MKHPALCFTAGLSLLLLPCLARAETPASVLKDGQIKVFTESGDVQLLLADGSKRPLSKGDVFTDGSIVIAGPDGHAQLVFSNGATLKVEPNGQLEIKTFKQAPFDEKAVGGTFIALAKDPSQSETDLNLINGTVSGEVKPLDEDAGSKFTVDTPAGSAKVRGGVISLSVVRDAEGTVTKVTAIDHTGNSILTPRGGQTVTAPASIRHHPGSY